MRNGTFLKAALVATFVAVSSLAATPGQTDQPARGAGAGRGGQSTS
jgi:hypothetical protein